MGFPNNFMFRSGGSGGGTGGSAGINYVPLIFAGDSLTGINTYNDGASAVPVDGTGGVVTGLTTALDTTTPLVGSSSVRFSKDASNRQGEGWSYDFTVDRLSYEASNPLFWQFYIRTSSGYVNGDIRLFVYDKDTSTLLTVQDIANNSGSIVPNPNDGLISCTFYTTASSNDYRLIWHIAGTTAAAWDFDWDNITVSPVTTQPGAIVADYGTEAWTDSWANSTTSVKITREGPYVFVQGIASVTGAGATQFDITIPTAYAPSSIYTWGSNEAIYVGSSNSYDLSATGNFVGWASLVSTTTLRILYSNAGAIAGLTATAPFTWASGDKISFNACWVVANWAASAALSTSEAMFSTARARYSTNVAQSMANGTATRVDFEDKDYDTLNSVTTGASWVFTAPRSACYQVSGQILLASSAGWAAAEPCSCYIYKNGAAFALLDYKQANAAGTFILGAGGTGTVFLNKGDTVDFRVIQTSGGAINTDGATNNNWISIEEIPDLSIFSVYGQTEYQSATSGTKTPTATGNFSSMTTNSLTLTPGTWRIYGSALFSNSGNPAYTYAQAGWYAANGADSGVTPALLSTLSGVTIRTSGDTQFYSGNAVLAGGGAQVPVSTVILSTTSTVTVYLVPFASMTTAANARLIVYANAERLQ